MKSRSEIINLLREKGVTPTHQRVQIAAVLFGREPRHYSAEQVLHEVNADAMEVSKATVYNTLGLFARKGLVKEVIVDPSKVFYDPTTRPHHHFYNVDTGNLVDIQAGAIELAGLPELPLGTVAEGVDVVIRIRNAS